MTRCSHALLVSVLLMLPAAGAFALKSPAPGNTVQQPAPAPARKTTNTPTEKPVAETTQAPARSPPSERIQADSAVSFPVDI